jgi:hypothetical protein
MEGGKGAASRGGGRAAASLAALPAQAAHRSLLDSSRMPRSWGGLLRTDRPSSTGTLARRALLDNLLEVGTSVPCAI